MKDKQNIRAQYEAFTSASVKHSRDAKYQEINDAVYKWYCLARAAMVHVNSPMIQEEAAEKAKIFNMQDFEGFKASNGWFGRWKDRYGIKQRHVEGESGQVRSGTIESWMERLREVCKGYNPEDIWNQDEMGCFFCALVSSYTFSNNQSLLFTLFVMEEKLIINLIDKKLKPLIEKVALIEQSMKFLSDSYNNLLMKVNWGESTHDDLEKDILSQKAEIIQSTNEICMMKDILNDHEQYSRRECLEIRGVPMHRVEDTNKIVKDVGKLIGVEIKVIDLSISHEPAAPDPNIKQPRAITVKFARRDVQNNLYTAKKNLRNK